MNRAIIKDGIDGEVVYDGPYTLPGESGNYAGLEITNPEGDPLQMEFSTLAKWAGLDPDDREAHEYRCVWEGGELTEAYVDGKQVFPPTSEPVPWQPWRSRNEQRV